MFYDLCWYWDTLNDWENPKLGRWHGVSHRIVRSRCYWLLNDIGTVLARTNLQQVTWDEIANTDIMNIIRDYHEKLEKMVGDDHYVSTESEFELFVNEDVPDPSEEAYEGLREKWHEDLYQGYDLPDIDDLSLDTNDRYNKYIFYSYLGAEILLPEQDENKKMANVIKQLKVTMVIQWRHDTITLCCILQNTPLKFLIDRHRK